MGGELVSFCVLTIRFINTSLYYEFSKSGEDKPILLYIKPHQGSKTKTYIQKSIFISVLAMVFFVSI